MSDPDRLPGVGPMLCSQYLAASAMLRRAVEACPPHLWKAREEKHPFWHVAYHAVFYLDLYLAESEDAYDAPPLHEEDRQFLAGEYPHPPFRVETPDRPTSREDLLAWLEAAEERAAATLAALDPATLAAPSGFHWLDVTRGERLLYNLRHVQHHVGQLNLALARATGAAPAWVGRVSGPPPGGS